MYISEKKSTFNFFFFFLSPADSPKDLASELVHHAFISEVSMRSSNHQSSLLSKGWHA